MYVKYNILTIFCLCQTFKSFESLICSIKNRLNSSCFGREFAQINWTIQDQRVFTWMCILFLGCFFPFESLHMGYEYSASGKILLSLLQNVKVKGIGGTQPFSLRNMEHHWEGERKREVCQRNERLCEERQSIWVCAWERERQSIIEDRVKGLAKQPWCNLSSRSWPLATSCRPRLFSLTSLLPLVQ